MNSRSLKANERSSLECIFQRSPSDAMSTSSSSGRSSKTRLRPITSNGTPRNAAKGLEPTPSVHHTPGHLPRYLARDRSATTVESRYRTPSRIPTPVSREVSRNRPSSGRAEESKRTTTVKQTPDKRGSRTKIPPSEGGLANAVRKVETAEMMIKIAELERKCQRQQEKLLEQHELIKLLVKRDATEQQLVIDLRELQTHDEKQRQLEKTISDLRQELAEKCSELIKAEGLKERIKTLKERLAEAGRSTEEKDETIFELTEKLAIADEELVKLRQDKQSLENRVTQLNETKEDLQAEICAMKEKLAMLEEEVVQLTEDKCSLERRINESQEELQDEIHCMNRDIQEKNEKIDELQEEIRKLKFNQIMQEEALKTEKIALKIKSAILQSRVSSFEATMRTASSLQPIEKDRQFEQLIDEIGQNHRRCRSARSKLLEMLQLLKKNTGNVSNPEGLPALFEQQHIEEKQNGDAASIGELKEQLMSQIRGLFPGEEFEESEEQITGRIVYNKEEI